MAGALSEFSRRPLPVKIGIFAGIGALMGLLYWQFLYQPLKTEREDASAQLDSERAQSRKLKEQKEEYERKILRQDELKNQIEQNQKALPTESEMPAFFDMLARRTGEAGVEAIRRSVGAEAPIEAFVKVPVEIEVAGTFYQLKRFFSSLRPDRHESAEPLPTTATGAVEEKDRIVTIENLTISDPKVKNGEIMLTAKFTAATFRAADQAPEAPAAAPAAKPATPPPSATPKPATPTAPTGAAGTAPAGATGTSAKPKEMKAAVEAAGTAAEERTKKATDGKVAPPETTPGAKPVAPAPNATGTADAKGGL